MNLFRNNKQSLKKIKSPLIPNKRLLDPDDAQLFFSLMDSLDIFVGTASGIFQKYKNKTVEFNALREEVREHWYKNLWLIDRFIQSRNDLTQEQKDLLLSWKKRISGGFLCLKVYSEFAVFVPMDNENGTAFYAVRALTEDFEYVVRMKAPFALTTALLPFKNSIIWDGLAGVYPIHFGMEMRTGLEEDAKRRYENGTIVSQLI